MGCAKIGIVQLWREITKGAGVVEACGWKRGGREL